MPSSTTSLHVRVFLSSPGDVVEERKRAEAVFEKLQHDPFLPNGLIIDSFAWDKQGEDVPFLATMSPQDAVNQGLGKPSDCDVVIVIFWTRMGTPLPPEYKKPDGTGYLSGTEWEYWDAVQAARKTGLPKILIYRRMETVEFRPDDPDYAEKTDQFNKVEAFFKRFTNPDGSINTGYNQYHTLADFEEQLERHLKLVIKDLVKDPAQVQPERPAPTNRPVIIPLFAALLLVVAIIAAVFGVIVPSRNASNATATSSAGTQIALTQSTGATATYSAVMDVTATQQAALNQFLGDWVSSGPSNNPTIGAMSINPIGANEVIITYASYWSPENQHTDAEFTYAIPHVPFSLNDAALSAGTDDIDMVIRPASGGYLVISSNISGSPDPELLQRQTTAFVLKSPISLIYRPISPSVENDLLHEMLNYRPDDLIVPELTKEHSR